MNFSKKHKLIIIGVIFFLSLLSYYFKNSFNYKTEQRLSFRMVLIPDGQYLMGSEGKNAYDNEKPVHEVLTGYKEHTFLPQEEEFCFYHPKTIDRQ